MKNSHCKQCGVELQQEDESLLLDGGLYCPFCAKELESNEYASLELDFDPFSDEELAKSEAYLASDEYQEIERQHVQSRGARLDDTTWLGDGRHSRDSLQPPRENPTGEGVSSLFIWGAIAVVVLISVFGSISEDHRKIAEEKQRREFLEQLPQIRLYDIPKLHNTPKLPDTPNPYDIFIMNELLNKPQNFTITKRGMKGQSTCESLEKLMQLLEGNSDNFEPKKGFSHVKKEAAKEMEWLTFSIEKTPDTNFFILEKSTHSNKFYANMKLAIQRTSDPIEIALELNLLFDAVRVEKTDAKMYFLIQHTLPKNVDGISKGVQAFTILSKPIDLRASRPAKKRFLLKSLTFRIIQPNACAFFKTFDYSFFLKGFQLSRLMIVEGCFVSMTSSFPLRRLITFCSSIGFRTSCKSSSNSNAD